MVLSYVSWQWRDSVLGKGGRKEHTQARDTEWHLCQLCPWIHTRPIEEPHLVFKCYELERALAGMEDTVF
jgi:hypothetical protein